MKVAIRETVEVTDEQRNALAERIDGKPTKRQATREEFKDFIWTHGTAWPKVLTGVDEPESDEDEPSLEDLL